MEASDVLSGGNVEIREISTEMRSAYLDYAMSVIVGRALPDVRDGLKPVHRRVLYAMHDLGLQPNRPYRKSATIVGEVMGKYHPHGDQAIYDTLVRMAQDFSLRAPLVDGQGNFGSIDDDPPAAMRYTEARLARIATEMLRDIEEETVDFGPNYDESLERAAGPAGAVPEPARQRIVGHRGRHGDEHPAAQPRRGRSARSAPTSTDPEIDTDGLMKYVKGPDFPSGGTIMGTRRDQGRLPVGPRVGPGARQGAHRADQERQGGDHRLRAPVHGQEGRRRRPDHEDRRPGPRQEDHRDLRPARRVGPLGHAPRDRAQARRDPEGRAEQALQAHADAVDLRRQHGRARRRRAADALAEGDDPPLRRATSARSSSAGRSSSSARPRPALTSSRAC